MTFSHPSPATIISHLDFCNNLLTALPTLIPLIVDHPYSQNNLCKTQIRLGFEIFVYVFHWEDTKILALDYKVLRDTASVILSSHTSCHSLQSPARLPKSWTLKVIPTSPSKPSFSPFSLLNSSLFFHCLIFMARFPITVASAQMSHPQRCLNSPSYLNEWPHSIPGSWGVSTSMHVYV